MADNVEANAGSGGATFATDDDGTAHHPYVKLEWGADNTQTKVAAGAGALPIQDGGNSITVDGTVDLGATDNAVLDAIAASVAAIDTDATTIIGHLDGVETLLGTIDTDTGNIATATAAIQAAVEGTLTVGSHAVTNAGTFATQVDGAALTALQLIDNVIYVDDADWTDSTSSHALVGGLYQSTPQTVTDGDVAPFQIDANGRLIVVATDGGGALTVDGSLTVDLGANNDVTVTGTVDLGATDNAVLDAIAASVAAIDTDATTIIGHLDGVETLLGTIDTDTGNIATSASAIQTAVQLIDNTIIADDAAFTPATTSVNMAGFFADETSTDSVNEGDAGAARMTLDRKVIVTTQPHTSGGYSIIKNLDVDETEDAIKATAGKLYQLYLFNTTNAALYCKLYNATTANVTVGTTAPVMTIPVPGNNDTDGAGVVLNWPDGITFDTAITIAATTAAADNDTGAPGAGALIASGAYL